MRITNLNILFLLLIFCSALNSIAQENSYGIKPASKECQNLMVSENALTTVGNSIFIEKGKVILAYHNSQYIKDIFKDQKDGLAIDLLLEDQYLCGVENKVNSSLVYEGILQRPIYRDELIKGNKATNTNRFIAQIGTIPDSLIGKNIVPAMIVIKNGFACYWSSPIKIPHKTFEPIPYDLKTNPEPTITFLEKGVISSKQIFFEFNRNITETKKHDPLPTSKNNIHTIEIKSFSSIEGDSINNENLHTKRAEFMKNTILKTTPIKNIAIEAKENWEKCIFQMEMLGLEKESKLPKDSIRKFVMFDKQNNWDSILHTQRKSNAIIYFTGQVEKNNPSKFLTMNLQTALLEKNIPLANKALDSLYSLKMFSPILLDESVVTKLLDYPTLVANTTAVYSLSTNFQSEEMIRYVRFWLLNSQKLDPIAKQNLIYLYARTCKQMLNKWDVETAKLVKVLHPSRAEVVLNSLGNNCPTIIQLDYNIGAIDYYSQTNEYKSIKPKFDFIESFFKKQKLTPKEIEELALFYNHWGKFDFTLQLLYKELDNPSLTSKSLFALAKTSSAGEMRKLSSINYMRIMRKTYEREPLLFCQWISETFNLLSNPDLKTFYCEKCKKEQK